MFQLNLGSPRGADRLLTVLCLGAHADDIEIGCGGTILKMLRERSDIEIYWYVFGARDQRAQEAVESADLFLEGAKKKKIEVRGFRDGFFPYQGAEIKELFEGMKKEVNPDIIFTHYREDLHQDHRVISELTWNTFRDHWVLEYEIPKYDGDLGSPNLFVYLDETTCKAKIQHIVNVFKTQKQKHWFTEDVFWGLLRLRGFECVSTGKYAEAYYCRKTIISL